MVLDARACIGDTITIRDGVAKKQSGRQIPMHPDLKEALRALSRSGGTSGPVIRSARGGAMRPNSIVNWFVTLFAELGIEGCSSHSGRRTFITTAARQGTSSGMQPARRAIARGSPIDRDHAGVYRR